MFITLLFLPDLLIVSKTSHSVGTILVIINDDEHNDDDDNDDDVPYGAAADNNDRNVDAHSWDKNLALSDLLNTSQVSFEIFLQFLELFFYYPVQKLSKINWFLLQDIQLFVTIPKYEDIENDERYDGENKVENFKPDIHHYIPVIRSAKDERGQRC